MPICGPHSRRKPPAGPELLALSRFGWAPAGNPNTWLWKFVDNGYERLAEIGDKDNFGNSITSTSSTRTNLQPILGRDNQPTQERVLLDSNCQPLKDADTPGAVVVTPTWGDFEEALFNGIPILSAYVI